MSPLLSPLSYGPEALVVSSRRRLDDNRASKAIDRRTLLPLVGRIGEQLHTSPPVGEMGRLAGMSPSHCARTFPRSTGLIPQRFDDRRRIRRALAVLRDWSTPLADVSLRLGFSSQSHFTRLFSGLTGMTPARYRRQCKRTIG